MASTLALRPSYWASVSGGKDSLYMLKVITENPGEYPLDGVVHYEIDIDYPFIKDVIDYMQADCERHGIRFVRIKPEHTFDELYEKYLLPDKIKRWCNREFKLKSQARLNAFMKEQGAYVVSYIGFCADEVSRFKYGLFDRDDTVRQIYPLAEMGIEEKQILEWARNVPIFNDYYKFNDRCGCMYCPMSSMQNMAYLLKYYPEHYEKFIRMAIETEAILTEKLGRHHGVFHGNEKYTAEYRDKMIRNKYLPELEEKIQMYGMLKAITK